MFSIRLQMCIKQEYEIMLSRIIDWACVSLSYIPYIYAMFYKYFTGFIDFQMNLFIGRAWFIYSIFDVLYKVPRVIFNVIHIFMVQLKHDIR